jgi:tetrahydromethanopterin S-methyltransferase subunit F|tara:strand:- start:222 stop:407 length:186 start_codon:yes stop_codon:yes gene_type:complete
MKPYLKHIISEAARLWKNTIHLSYKGRYNEQRMLVRQLQYENTQLIKRNDKLRVENDHLKK